MWIKKGNKSKLWFEKYKARLSETTFHQCQGINCLIQGWFELSTDGRTGS